MKTIFRFLMIPLLLMLVSGALWAKEKKIIAVLPFTVHSGENIDYVRQGIWDMLSSRIYVSDKIEVLSKDITLNALKEKGGKDLTLEDVYGLGKKINVDYVVWGSITKIGNSLSIDGKLMDIAAYKSTLNVFAQSQGLDEVIPKINDFAQRIDQQILGIVPPAFTPPPAPAQSTSLQQQPPQSSRESEIITGMRTSKKGTLTSVVNPDFITSTEPIVRKDFWRSQKFPVEFKGMDIGDVNNDGLNEVVIIDNNSVMIYQKKDNDFRLIQKIPGKSGDNYLAVDVADIKHNGTKQIIVTNIKTTTLASFILEFREGTFVPIASNLPWFLRVIESESGTTLLGQRYGFNRPFDTIIYEIVWEDGEFREGRKMKVPEGLPIYGLTIDTLVTGGTEKVLAIDENGYLNIFEKTDKPLSRVLTFGGASELVSKSEDKYGGSNNYVEVSGRFGNIGYDRSDVQPDNYAYINQRILTHDISRSGKKKVIVVKNYSGAGTLFKNLKLYSSSELYELEWEGFGLLENWKTKKINGYIADYQFKDIDNDGQKEIVLALIPSIGGFSTKSSIIVVYKLTPQQGS